MQAVERYGDEVGYVFTSGELTYNRLKQTSDLLARGLLRLGVTKGDKVAIWMAGYAEWAFVYFALARIGAIMVPVNTRYRPEEIKYVLNKSKASLLVFKEEPNKDFLGLLKQLFPGWRVCRQFAQRNTALSARADCSFGSANRWLSRL